MFNAILYRIFDRPYIDENPSNRSLPGWVRRQLKEGVQVTVEFVPGFERLHPGPMTGFLSYDCRPAHTKPEYSVMSDYFRLQPSPTQEVPGVAFCALRNLKSISIVDGTGNKKKIYERKS